MKKYIDANLWIAERTVLEAKKQALETTVVTNTVEQVVSQPILQQQTVFSHYDVGHTPDETNKIQQIYQELENLVRMPGLAL